MKVAYCTPMRVERDGIGAYSRELYASLSKRCALEPFPLDKERHGASHFRKMAEAINCCDILHLEHSSNFFQVPLFPFREGYRDFLRRVRVPRMVVYHEPVDRTPVYFSRGAQSLSGRAGNALLYAAKAAARPFADAWWIPRYNREIFTLPERVVVHTGFHAELVRRFAPGARVAVSPHPVYLPMEIESVGGPDLQIPFSKEDVVLTVFGFIEPRKDYLGVLRAMLRLPAKYKLLVAGGCHDERERESTSSVYGRMMSFARENGLRDRLHVTGFYPDASVPTIVAGTDMVLAPLTVDHSSGSINIGIAYSRPVIAYRTRLTQEMNRNGAGILEIGGGEEIADLLLEAERKPEPFRRAVSLGSAYRIHYGFPATADKYVRWYEELAGARGGK